MTLHSPTDFAISEETIRVARAAYPRGNVLMKMRDALGTISQDQSFASLFPHNGRAVEAPWRLALIPVLQFMEELPDRQAVDTIPPATLFISSPYDPEAHLGKKRRTLWTGYVRRVGADEIPA